MAAAATALNGSYGPKIPTKEMGQLILRANPLTPSTPCSIPPLHPRNPAHSPQNPPISSTPSISVPDSVRSRCRMDRERFDACGRECPLIWCANVSAAGGGRRWPTRFRWRAALFRERRAKPATGPGFCFLPDGQVAGHRRGPVADMAHLFAPGSVPEHAPKASPAARPGRGRGNPGGGP
jgi:hypothetical protein